MYHSGLSASPEYRYGTGTAEYRHRTNTQPESPTRRDTPFSERWLQYEPDGGHLHSDRLQDSDKRWMWHREWRGKAYHGRWLWTSPAELGGARVLSSWGLWLVY